MDRPFKVDAGSAARAAEDEAREARREGLSGSGGPRGISLRLTPRASSAPAPEAVPHEQFQAAREIKLSVATGQKFEQPASAESKMPAPVAAPATPSPAEPAEPPALADKFLKWFGLKRIS
jgi:plasmid stability protein